MTAAATLINTLMFHRLHPLEADIKTSNLRKKGNFLELEVMPPKSGVEVK